MHRRNPHRDGNDFARLVGASPELAPHIRAHPVAGETIDFSDPVAVLALNRAILRLHYGIAHWDIPAGYLCPPVPSRAEYLHIAADLVGQDGTGPHGAATRVLDIGVGANCIYPLIGARALGWSFVGTDVDPAALASARRLVEANPGLAGRIDLRLQPDPEAVFANVVKPGETFSLSICNPPFHGSAAEAAEGNLRKLCNLQGTAAASPVLNFGGRSHELWCRGGEAGFLRAMIAESAARPGLCRWFTSLVSKRGTVPVLERALRGARAAEVRFLPIAAGQKQGRIVAWRFGSKLG